MRELPDFSAAGTRKSPNYSFGNSVSRVRDCSVLRLLRLKANFGGGFLGIVRRAGMGHRGSVLITTPVTSGKRGVTYGAGVRTKCGGSSRNENYGQIFFKIAARR
jgi:hypothetical protein